MTDDLSARLQLVEDRLAIYNLLATHPLSADTGDAAFFNAIYTEDAAFDRGQGLSGASGRDSLLTMGTSDAHRAAIAGGLAHLGNLPRVQIDGDSAVAMSYIAIIHPDPTGEPQELPNHGTTDGFRIHRVVANRWELTRIDGTWRISRRTALPMDGAGPAIETIRSFADQPI
jgi:hypothetical protein